jgi:hypothetical protein
MGTHPLGLLLRRDTEEQDDHDAEQLADFVTRSSFKCSYDEEHIQYGEEVVHFTLYKVVLGVEPFLVIVGDEETGDYTYDPHWFEFSCWESLVEELEEMVKDAPPVRHPESLYRCDYCGSGILEDEVLAAGYLGEVHISPRMPPNPQTGIPQPTEHFVPSSHEPFIMCLCCLILTNEHTLELWEPEDLNHWGECQECTHARCWRWSACACLCHQEKEEETQEQE